MAADDTIELIPVPNDPRHRLVGTRFRFESGEYIVWADYLVMQNSVRPYLEEGGEMGSWNHSEMIPQELCAIRTRDEAKARAVEAALKERARP